MAINTKPSEGCLSFLIVIFFQGGSGVRGPLGSSGQDGPTVSLRVQHYTYLRQNAEKKKKKIESTILCFLH